MWSAWKMQRDPVSKIKIKGGSGSVTAHLFSMQKALGSAGSPDKVGEGSGRAGDAKGREKS